MKSIMQDENEKVCFICSRIFDDYACREPLHMHHVIYGRGFRAASEQYGLKVYLCLHHHEGDMFGSRDAVHGDGKAEDAWLKLKAQIAWEKTFTDDPGSEEAHRLFREIFGKNYI